MPGRTRAFLAGDVNGKRHSLVSVHRPRADKMLTRRFTTPEHEAAW